LDVRWIDVLAIPRYSAGVEVDRPATEEPVGKENHWFVVNAITAVSPVPILNPQKQP
jgi:hypothetical protein